jgi:hypothetical protein
MKKIYIAIVLFTFFTVSVGQTKSAGPVNLGGGLMTLKIDKNSTTSKVTVTLTAPTGPSDKWFGIGFNATGMSSGTDCLYYDNSFVDAKIIGQGTPQTDTDDTNNWTVSNTISGTTRTLVLTRDFVGGTGDYTFSYADPGLDIIWAYGNNTSITSGHQSKGTELLTFSVLGIEDFAALDKIAIAPNPSNGVFTISKNNQTTVSKITVFDTNGKVIKAIDSELNLEAIQIDLSKYSSGVYFVEISNDIDKIVRKIVKE